MEGHPYYDLVHETGRHLAEAGYTVLTGGGPGIMKAANRGAREPVGSQLAATSACLTNKDRIHGSIDLGSSIIFLCEKC